VIGSGILALIDNPEQLSSLIGQSTLAESAVEELLRYSNPAQFGASRIALEDLELGEVTIKKHDVVIAMLSSANRDEAIFQDPERLNISRNPNRHPGFGLGIHFCLGAPLARMEGRIAFNKLLARFPKIRLAVPRAEIRWRVTGFSWIEIATGLFGVSGGDPTCANSAASWNGVILSSNNVQSQPPFRRGAFGGYPTQTKIKKP
jgi:cytochrome P450